MTDFQQADKDQSGSLDEKEFSAYLAKINLERLRLEMEDEDAKRDSQRRMAWFALAGFLLFPFSVILTEWMALPKAGTLLSDMSSIYYLSVSALLGAYFGFTNMNLGSKDKK